MAASENKRCGVTRKRKPSRLRVYSDFLGGLTIIGLDRKYGVTRLWVEKAIRHYSKAMMKRGG